MGCHATNAALINSIREYFHPRFQNQNRRSRARVDMAEGSLAKPRRSSAHRHH
jgi:hypothetical protein